MNNLIDKISSYNLFNYLFPGVVFCLIADNFFSYSLIQDDIVVGLFLYYFVGLLISRLGSLIIEPFLKKIGFVEFADYPDFISATKNDSKIETLSEVNNMYRTLISLFFALAFLAGYEAVQNCWPRASDYMNHIIIFVILIIFLFAYKKQTKYIKERVTLNKE